MNRATCQLSIALLAIILTAIVVSAETNSVPLVSTNISLTPTNLCHATNAGHESDAEHSRPAGDDAAIRQRTSDGNRRTIHEAAAAKYESRFCVAVSSRSGIGGSRKSGGGKSDALVWQFAKFAVDTAPTIADNGIAK
jgi:hypothetical protein